MGILALSLGMVACSGGDDGEAAIPAKQLVEAVGQADAAIILPDVETCPEAGEPSDGTVSLPRYR